jgi:putative ABC transport system ATP-binding protein
MELVHTESLTTVYGDAAHPVHAVNGVDLAVEEGEFLAIMGPSGSGKSTLLYLIGGLERPTSGTVRLRESDLSTLDDDALSRLRRTELGFIFQFFNLIPVLTAHENVAMPLILDGVPRAEALKRADEALAKVGLADRSTHRPAELSGGEQQRVALARALAANPALILADEPTGNLDSNNSKEIIALLKLSNKRYHQTLIVVTHDRDIALQADRIISFGDGRIVRDEAVRA